MKNYVINENEYLSNIDLEKQHIKLELPAIKQQNFIHQNVNLRSLLVSFNDLFQGYINNLVLTVEKKGEEEAFKEINTLIETYSSFRKLLSPEDEIFVKNDFQQKILPYTQQSEFCKYCYDKPRGYAGDFMAMEMIWKGKNTEGNRYNGNGKIGEMINALTLDSLNCEANVYRVHYLKKKFYSTETVKLLQSDVVQ